jgi:PTH1 family peptidyl-tRNA hydrolase
MKLIVGLGNPGEKYAHNRHNVGFMAVDRIFVEHGFQPWRRRFSGEAAEGRIGNEKCLLLKPSTYMNESGRAAVEAMRFFRVELGDVIVIHDEIDLDPGRVKVKSGGGNAGHNGLRSLTSHIGNDYLRVRIGVGKPSDKAQVASYVLRDFAKAEAVWLDPLLAALAGNLPALLERGAAAFSTAMAKALAPDDREREPGRKRDDNASRPPGAAGGDSSDGRAGQQRNDASASPFVEKLRRLLRPKDDSDGD